MGDDGATSSHPILLHTSPPSNFRDIDFIDLCTDNEDGQSFCGDIEMKVISSGKKRRHLTTVDLCDTPVVAKQSRIKPVRPDPDNLSFNPLDQTAIHPASYNVATA